ncbi:ral guanine nucleotide dissociation stimulator-like [Dipodomys merriami]|uniref:ral guanine nucleotide dissociation stimulator-like n=1 Tax=Dipodomys merriami TaxID=94247 RepID=UPI0038557FAB
MWMDFYPDDFYEPKNNDTLKELTQNVKLNMASSDLLFCLHIFLDQLEKPMRQRKRGRSPCLDASELVCITVEKLLQNSR